MIISFSTTAKEWNKNPMQDKSLKLLHTGYIKTQTEGNSEKMEQNTWWKTRMCNDPMGEVYLYTQC